MIGDEIRIAKADAKREMRTFKRLCQVFTSTRPGDICVDHYKNKGKCICFRNRDFVRKWRWERATRDRK